MKSAFWIAVASLSLGGSAQAATLTYEGVPFTTFDYDLSPGAVSHPSRPFRGAFDDTMALNIIIELGADLMPGATYMLDSERYLMGGSWYDIEVLSLSANDGINTFDTVDWVDFTTDDQGQIVDWTVELHNTGGFDMDMLSTSATAGDAAFYQFEYSLAGATFATGFETASSSVATTGVWSMSSISAVPLPASAGFALAGLGGLAVIGWRRRKTGS